jgi:uncharacterized membrane protein
VSHQEAEASPPEENSASGFTRDASSDLLFNSSLRRLERMIPALAIAASLVMGFKIAWPVGLGFLAGAAVAYINFRWLKSTVMAFSDAVTQTGPPRSRPSVVLRFLTRFVLIAVGAYVIFVSYPVAFHGFLGGLLVPVLAILAEAGYAVYLAIRFGF